MPIIVEASTGYHNLGRFLNSLEQEHIFVDISDFSFVQSAINKKNHDLRMTIKTIILETAAKEPQ